jgi:hypothetical protein
VTPEHGLRSLGVVEHRELGRRELMLPQDRLGDDLVEGERVSERARRGDGSSPRSDDDLGENFPG